MKKQFKLVLLSALVMAVISTGLMIAFASQENDLEVQHDHEYFVASFSNGVATLECDICGETQTARFDEHINERGYEPLDINNDGIVNAKDYGYLIQGNY